MRTATDTIKTVCEGIGFLHFISCSLSNYQKIIREFEDKLLFHKLQRADFPFSFILKQKIYSAISMTYIKLNVET